MIRSNRLAFRSAAGVSAPRMAGLFGSGTRASLSREPSLQCTKHVTDLNAPAGLLQERERVKCARFAAEQS